MGYAVIAVLVCVLLDFMNPAQALGGWLGRRGASYRSCAYSSPDHLNIVSKSRGRLSSSKLHHISKMASTHPVMETIYNVIRVGVREGWALLSLQCWCVFCWIS